MLIVLLVRVLLDRQRRRCLPTAASHLAPAVGDRETADSATSATVARRQLDCMSATSTESQTALNQRDRERYDARHLSLYHFIMHMRFFRSKLLLCNKWSENLTKSRIARAEFSRGTM